MPLKTPTKGKFTDPPQKTLLKKKYLRKKKKNLTKQNKTKTKNEKTKQKKPNNNN